MGALTTGGLEGVVAGRTAICTAESAGDSLYYRGYDVGELAAQASYEEVAYLLAPDRKYFTKTSLNNY